jgi:hypothetical protein
MTSSPPPSAPSGTVTCPSCKSQATGKFCSNCGATLVATTCAACSASLAPGAKFCHRCGTPAGSDAPHPQPGFNAALPWAVAGIALVAFIALVAGQRFSRSPQQPAPDASAAPFASGAPTGTRAPDISNLTPAEAAARLYDRIMGAYERGQADTVQLFAPMAITSYGMIGDLNLDQHYDVGRIAQVSGDAQLAQAEADTILARNPNHLLGLILAANAAKMRNDVAAERSYYDKLKAAAPTEQPKQLNEYLEHQNDITTALAAKRP